MRDQPPPSMSFVDASELSELMLKLSPCWPATASSLVPALLVTIAMMFVPAMALEASAL